MTIMKPETRSDVGTQALRRARSRIVLKRTFASAAIAASVAGLWLVGCSSDASNTPADDTAGTSSSLAGSPSNSTAGSSSSNGGSPATAGSSSTTGGDGGSGGARPSRVGGACGDTKTCADGLECNHDITKGECTKDCTVAKATDECSKGNTVGVCGDDLKCHGPCGTPPDKICSRMGWVCDPTNTYCVPPVAGTGGGDSGGGGSVAGSDAGGMSSTTGGGGSGGLGEAGQTSEQ